MSYNKNKREEEENLMKKVVAHLADSSVYKSDDNPYSVNDGILTTGKGKKYITELKIRPKYTEASIIGFGGMLLEEKKLRNCSKLYTDEFETELLYVIQFQDKVVGYLIYALNEDTEENWVYDKYKVNEDFGNDNLIKKRVLYLQDKHKVFEFNL